jgi:hypothetical protein
MNKTQEIQTLRIFAEKNADVFPGGYRKEVAGIFKISWDLASSTAKAVLQLISFLGSVPVPRKLLREILDIPVESDIEDALDEAISELGDRLSLLTLDEDDGPRVHRLISAFARETADAPESVCSAWVEELARVADESNILCNEQIEKILPHAELWLSSEAIRTDQSIDLANYLCIQYWKLGRFRLAEKHGRKAAEISKRHFEPRHPKIATSQSNLAAVL